jgi:hypothetical protein
MCKVQDPRWVKPSREQGQSCLSEQGARVKAHEALKGSLIMFNKNSHKMKFGIWCISNYA